MQRNVFSFNSDCCSAEDNQFLKYVSGWCPYFSMFSCSRLREPRVPLLPSWKENYGCAGCAKYASAARLPSCRMNQGTP